MNSQPDIVHKEAGFTLIEVLCVLVLIGLFSSMVVVNMPSQKTPTRIQAENFVKAVNGLAQEGLISGEIRALGISQSEYAFYTYDGTDFEILAQTAWNDEVSPLLFIRDNPIALPEDLTAQIIFEPTGLNTEFRLSLSGRKDSFDIVSTGDGRAEMVQTE